jgi:hypothetical protein
MSNTTVNSKGDEIGYSQWSQDWFIYNNFFKNTLEMGGEDTGTPLETSGEDAAHVYIDIGAGDPYALSNTAVFEKCFKWDGLLHSFRVYFQSSPLVSSVFVVFSTRFECTFSLLHSFRVYL